MTWIVPSSLAIGWSPVSRSMIASRRAARAAGPSMKKPSLSGPRWTSVALMRASRSGSAGPFAQTIPQIPHTRRSVVAIPAMAACLSPATTRRLSPPWPLLRLSSLSDLWLGASDREPGAPSVAGALVPVPQEPSHRLGEDAEGSRDQRADVQRHRAVGDPLHVMGELLGHRGLVAAAHLGEAGQARAHDEPLPVGGELTRQLFEEPGPDRTRADEAHVAAENVPELRQFVELHRAEAAAEPRGLRARPLNELRAEIRAEPFLGAAPERAELEHLEDPAVAADALAPVEEREAGGEQEADPDQDQQREGDQEEEAREKDVEQSQLDVDAALRRAADEAGEALDERVAGAWLRRGAPARLGRGHAEMLEPRPGRASLASRPRPMV